MHRCIHKCNTNGQEESSHPMLLAPEKPWTCSRSHAYHSQVLPVQDTRKFHLQEPLARSRNHRVQLRKNQVETHIEKVGEGWNHLGYLQDITRAPEASQHQNLPHPSGVQSWSTQITQSMCIPERVIVFFFLNIDWKEGHMWMCHTCSSLWDLLEMIISVWKSYTKKLHRILQNSYSSCASFLCFWNPFSCIFSLIYAGESTSAVNIGNKFVSSFPSFAGVSFQVIII